MLIDSAYVLLKLLSDTEQRNAFLLWPGCSVAQLLFVLLLCLCIGTADDEDRWLLLEGKT